MGGDDRPQGKVGDEHGVGVGHGEGLWALEGPHRHVGSDGRPQGEGGDGHGVGFGHGEGLEALEGPHGHVGGDGRPQGEGGDGHGVGVGHGEGLEALRSEEHTSDLRVLFGGFPLWRLQWTRQRRFDPWTI